MKRFSCCLAITVACASASFAADDQKPAATAPAPTTKIATTAEKDSAAKPATTAAKTAASTASPEESCDCGAETDSLAAKKTFLSPRAKEAQRKPVISGT